MTAETAPESEPAPSPPEDVSQDAPEDEPGTELMLRPSLLPSEGQYEAIRRWSRVMADSHFFKDAQTAEQAAVKILYGTELGFTVGASMSGIHIIEGKPTIGAGLMAAAVKRSTKYDYRVLEHTDTICRLQFFEGGQPVGESEFTVDDAERAGLFGRVSRTWEKYPRNMVFARAMSNGISWFAPDVFESGRVYTANELNPDLELNADGDILDVQAIAPPPPREERAPAAERPAQDRPAQDRPAQAPSNRGGRGPETPEEIADVAGLLMWAGTYRQQHGLTISQRAVMTALEVDVPGEIVANYKDDWMRAARMIIADVDLTLALAALTDEQRAEYATLVDEGGMPPEDALAVVRPEPEPEPEPAPEPEPEPEAAAEAEPEAAAEAPSDDEPTPEPEPVDATPEAEPAAKPPRARKR